MKGEDYRPNALEKLISTWPLFAGSAIVAAGLGYVWYCMTHPPYLLNRWLVLLVCGSGIMLVLYWAFSDDTGTGSI